MGNVQDRQTRGKSQGEAAHDPALRPQRPAVSKCPAPLPGDQPPGVSTPPRGGRPAPPSASARLGERSTSSSARPGPARLSPALPHASSSIFAARSLLPAGRAAVFGDAVGRGAGFGFSPVRKPFGGAAPIAGLTETYKEPEVFNRPIFLIAKMVLSSFFRF